MSGIEGGSRRVTPGGRALVGGVTRVSRSCSGEGKALPWLRGTVSEDV